MVSKFLLITAVIAYVEARFGQENVPIAAISAVQGGNAGAAATIGGQAISDLLGAANSCAKLQRADQVVTELGGGADAIAAAIGLVTAEKNTNPFANNNVQNVCGDPSLPATAELRGITPLIDPDVDANGDAAALSASSAASPLNADGLSVFDLMSAAGLGDLVVSQAANGGAAAGAAAGGNAGGNNQQANNQQGQNQQGQNQAGGNANQQQAASNGGNQQANDQGQANNNNNQQAGGANQNADAGNVSNGTQSGNQNAGNNANQNAGNNANQGQGQGQDQGQNQNQGQNQGQDQNAGNNNQQNAGNANQGAAGNAGAGAAAGGAADFGQCTPTIDLAGGRNGRAADELTFQITDPLARGGQQEALNPNIITNALCNQLTNVCDANEAAVAACEDAKAQVAAAGTRDQSTADLFNSALGFGGAANRKRGMRRGLRL